VRLGNVIIQSGSSTEVACEEFSEFQGEVVEK
jgi:hypothetical protein